MKKPIIVVGMGELGSVLARGFLKLGYPVQAVTREMNMVQIAENYPDPHAVLIAVGEGDIHQVMQDIPHPWQKDSILLQNELLPRDWKETDLLEPTVISVWFEKKKGMDSKVVLPSPVYGKHARLVFDALAKLDLPSYIVDTQEELEYELVRKNLYILTTNIAGLECGGNVMHLKENHPELLQDVVKDVLTLQSSLVGHELDSDKLMEGMLEAFSGDPEHGCMGRSAPIRLARALNIAHDLGIELPTLQKIQNKH